MNSFQILDAKGNALTMGVLDAEVAAFWGQKIQKTTYAHPKNALYNWYDTIGWAIAYQNSDDYSVNTWESVVHYLFVNTMGEFIVDCKNCKFEDFDTVKQNLENIQELYTPMLELIKYWKNKGYTPKQIKDQ